MLLKVLLNALKKSKAKESKKYTETLLFREKEEAYSEGTGDCRKENKKNFVYTFLRRKKT